MTSKEKDAEREGHVLRHTLKWGGTAILFSLLAGAFLMRSWTLFWIALPLGIAYFMMLTMPVFLAVLSSGEKQDRA